MLINQLKKYLPRHASSSIEPRAYKTRESIAVPLSEAAKPPFVVNVAILLMMSQSPAIVPVPHKQNFNIIYFLSEHSALIIIQVYTRFLIIASIKSNYFFIITPTVDKHGKIYKQHNTRIERLYIITDYVCDAMYRIDLFIRKKIP